MNEHEQTCNVCKSACLVTLKHQACVWGWEDKKIRLKKKETQPLKILNDSLRSLNFVPRQWEAKVFITRRKACPDLFWKDDWQAKESSGGKYKLVTESYKLFLLQMIENLMNSSLCKKFIYWLLFLHNTRVDSASDSPSLSSAFSVLTHSQATTLIVPRWYPARKNRIVVPVSQLKPQHSSEWDQLRS